MTAPVAFRWNGEAMIPVHGWIADREFVIGERYLLVEHLERSHASHAHFFACINEAFANLPEDQAGRFKSAEHLRKWALIKAGYADERTVVCGSKAEAERVAAFIEPLDEYAVVAANAATVTVWTAKSQSMRAMGKETFQASKDAVLSVLADLLGVEPEALSQRAAAA